MDEEVENFLAHYGVRGMKWGARKQARVLRREAKGQARIEKSGSSGRAVGRVVVRQLLTDAGLGIGATLVGSLSGGNVNVAQGASIVAGLASTATWAKSINDVVNINAAVNKDN